MTPSLRTGFAVQSGDNSSATPQRWDALDLRPRRIAARLPEIKGFETPREGHYHFGKKPGEFTHYGDAAFVMLVSVAELGRFDAADFGKWFVRKFGSPDYKAISMTRQRERWRTMPRSRKRIRQTVRLPARGGRRSTRHGIESRAGHCRTPP